MGNEINDERTQSPLPTGEGRGGALLDIKKELRANMNGVASAAMRQTDDYRINWGIELPRIQGIANEFEASHELAQALWKESVRECKILACMLMPIDDFDEELCDIWVEDIHTDEIAQMFCMYLVVRLPFASKKAFEWMASDRTILQNCGYLTLCHLIRKYQLSEASEEEFLDQASTALDNRYAVRALQIYGSQSEDNAVKVKKVADFLL